LETAAADGQWIIDQVKNEYLNLKKQFFQGQDNFVEIKENCFPDDPGSSSFSLCKWILIMDLQGF
jgi:hypothetical protein